MREKSFGLGNPGQTKKGTGGRYLFGKKEKAGRTERGKGGEEKEKRVWGTAGSSKIRGRVARGRKTRRMSRSLLKKKKKGI